MYKRQGLFEDPDSQEKIRRCRLNLSNNAVTIEDFTLLPSVNQWKKTELLHSVVYTVSRLNVSNPFRGEGELVRVTKSANSTIQLDMCPVFYGLRKWITTYSICFKFSNMAIHATHTRTVEKSNCSERESRRRNKVRRQLEKRCRLCNPSTDKAVNFGYLDRLYEFVPEKDFFEQENREALPKTKIEISSLRQVTREQIKGKFENDVKEAMKRLVEIITDDRVE